MCSLDSFYGLSVYIYAVVTVVVMYRVEAPTIEVQLLSAVQNLSIIMSKNYNRSKFDKHTNFTVYHKVQLNSFNEPYWDEGKIFYPKYRRGRKNPHKHILRYEMRRYRTWKYNRKTKWKVGRVV